MSKVLIHSLVFSPDGVSTAYLMTELALELKSLGHSVTVISTTPHYNLLKEAAEKQPMRKLWFGLLYLSKIDGIPVWHAKVPDKGDRVWLRVFDYIRFHTISVLVAIFKIERQDVVIATSPPLTMGVLSWFMGVIWKCSSIYKVAELYPDVAIRQGIVKNKTFIAFLNWLEQFVYRRNTVIVPIAEQFKRVIKKRNVQDNKLRMIPDFVDTNFYTPKERRNAFSVKHNLVNDFIVLYAGNIGIVQDWESVLYAAENLSAYPIRFIIIGDGSKREWFQKTIGEKNLKNVTLLGYQSKDLMPLINSSCDVSIIPMNMAGSKDGVPSKIYSIMSCAKPAIALVDSDSELRCIIDQSQCGTSVDIGDSKGFLEAILEAFNKRESLPAEGMRGRVYVETHYSKEAIANMYDELIKEISSRKN